MVLNCCRVDNFEQEIRISDVSSLFPLNFDIVYECSLRLQVILGATLLFLQLAVMASLTSTLKTRNWEEAIGLHSADFVSRQESKQSTVDLVVICPQSSQDHET